MKLAKWLLFIWFALTFPAIFYLILVAGFLPLVAIAGVAVKFNNSLLFLVCMAHLLVYSFAYYWAARQITEAIWVLKPKYRYWSIMAVIGICGVIALIPMYGVSGGVSTTGRESGAKTTNAYMLYWKFIQEQLDKLSQVKELSIGVSTKPNQTVDLHNLCLDNVPILKLGEIKSDNSHAPVIVAHNYNQLIPKHIDIYFSEKKNTKWYEVHLTLPNDTTERAKQLPALVEFSPRRTRNVVDEVFIFIDLVPDGTVSVWLANTNNAMHPRGVLEKITETHATIAPREPLDMSCKHGSYTAIQE
jgi:hypothetical protein